MTQFDGKIIPCVDHDHCTKKVRGILCRQCNRLLGLFKDKTELLNNAIIYLEMGSIVRLIEHDFEWARSELVNPARAYRLRHEYDLSPDDFFEMVSIQSGGCAICNKKLTPRSGTHIDHCHATGKIRGLLCQLCNIGIGQSLDNPEIFRKAINYLDSTKFS